MKILRSNHRIPALLAAISIVSAAPAIAAEFTDSVPMPLVKALVSGPPGDEVRIYSEIPGGFPDVAIPAGFSVLGGIEQQSNSRVFLQTTAGREEAVAALSGALINAGFIDMQTLATARQTGFTMPNGMMSPRNFCRDDVGYMTIMFTEEPGLNRVSMGVSRSIFESGPSTCAALVEPEGLMLGRGGAVFTELTKHMPVMVLPDEATNSRQPFLGSSGSSSNGRTETTTTFASDLTVPQLYQHFAQQIAAQGWALDGESTGEVSASGNWIKIPDADTYLHGAFSLVQSSESNFTISFRLTKLNVEQ